MDRSITINGTGLSRDTIHITIIYLNNKSFRELLTFGKSRIYFLRLCIYFCDSPEINRILVHYINVHFSIDLLHFTK